MSSLDISGSQPPPTREAQAPGLEAFGLWLMAAYWLALLAILGLAGMASGG